MSWNNTTKQVEISLGGGLLLTSSRVNPGRLIDCRNYEISPAGGYRPSEGYEPVDGKQLPSEAEFKVVVIENVTTEVFEGDTITDGSSKSGIALIDSVLESGDYDGTGSGYIVLLPVSGDFESGDEIHLGSKIADVSSVFENGDAVSSVDEVDWAALAIEKQLGRIEAVPGEGDVLGVVEYKDTLYAFRNNVGGATASMYKSTSDGWVAVSGADSLNPDGRYRFKINNFKGSSETINLYGCDGKNKAFEFDGTTFTQITTGMVDDTPSNIEIFKNHLLLGYTGGSLQHSSIGDPTAPWTIISGAAEIGLGDEMIAMEVTVSSSLVIWTEKHIQILTGTSSADWVLSLHSSRVGAVEDSVQIFGETPLFLYEGSLTSLSATQSYGDFSSKSISEDIDPLLERSAEWGGITASCVVPSKSQYRLFFGNKLAITATNRKSGMEFMLLEYDHKVCCTSPHDKNAYFGSEDGFVYKMDSGKTYAGATIPRFLKTRFSDLGSAKRRKVLRSMELYVEDYGGHNLHLYVLPEIGQHRKYSPKNASKEITSQAGDMYWNVSLWNQATWNAETSEPPYTRLNGIGTDFSFIFYSGKDADDTYTLTGFLLHYSNRGLQR